MASRAALLLALCLLCGAALARPAGTSIGVGVAKAGEGADAQPTSTKAVAIAAGTGLKAASVEGKSLANKNANWTIRVRVTCYCASCRFSIRYTDYRKRTGTFNYNLRRNQYVWFNQHWNYYYFVNGYRYDPEITAARRFC